MSEFNVEKLEKGRHEESRLLWREVFPEDGDAFLDAYFADKGKRNEIAVIQDDSDALCSMIHWNPVEVSFQRTRIMADFLVAVATREDCRRQGMMRELLMRGLEERCGRKMPFVFLTPASEVYYQPFGFVSVEQERMYSSTDKLFENIVGQDFYIRKIIPEEYKKTASWMNTCLKERSDLFAWRSDTYLTTLEKELASEGGAIMGIFHKGETYPEEKEKLICVFLYTMAGGFEIREPVCRKNEEEMVYKILSDSAPIRISCRIMVRIVSLEACIRLIRAKELFEEKISVSDPVLPENDGIFLLRLSPEGNKLTRISAEKPVAGGKGVSDMIPVSVEELTKLIFNRVSLFEIV